MPSSRGSPQARDRTHVSCAAGRFFTAEPPEKPIFSVYFTYCINAYIQRIRKRAVIKQCEKDVQSNRIKARDMIRKFQEADVIKHQKRPFFLCQICKDESLMMALPLPLWGLTVFPFPHSSPATRPPFCALKMQGDHSRTAFAPICLERCPRRPHGLLPHFRSSPAWLPCLKLQPYLPLYQHNICLPCLFFFTALITL